MVWWGLITLIERENDIVNFFMIFKCINGKNKNKNRRNPILYFI